MTTDPLDDLVSDSLGVLDNIAGVMDELHRIDIVLPVDERELREAHESIRTMLAELREQLAAVMDTVHRIGIVPPADERELREELAELRELLRLALRYTVRVRLAAGGEAQP